MSGVRIFVAAAITGVTIAIGIMLCTLHPAETSGTGPTPTWAYALTFLVGFVGGGAAVAILVEGWRKQRAA
jgi:hypothetical protein